MKYGVFLGVFFSVFPGCGGSSDRAIDGETTPAVSTVSQGLSSDPRTRMVQEASYAMWGNHYTHGSANWPTGTVYATHAYTSEDRGAWDMLLKDVVYGNGHFVSCNGSFLPCNLMYGAKSPYYNCQGYCPARFYRGGQCKAFANLVAYRSGQYQNPGYVFREFPHDDVINRQPMATYENISSGDILRRTNSSSPHAVIVVKKISPLRVIVVDSNFIGTSIASSGNGHEIVGSHEMSFSGSGTVSDLKTYRVLKCMYGPNRSC